MIQSNLWLIFASFSGRMRLSISAALPKSEKVFSSSDRHLLTLSRRASVSNVLWEFSNILGKVHPLSLDLRNQKAYYERIVKMFEVKLKAL